MKGNPVLLNKTFVVGVIILFIGVGIQPAIALNESTSISDDKDECNLCPKVSKQHIDRIKGLIDRLDTLNTKLSKVSKHYPELEEKYQELSENIMSLKELNKNLEPDKSMDDYPYPIICNILSVFVIIVQLLAGIALILIDIHDELYPYDYHYLPPLCTIAIFILLPFYFGYLNKCMG